LNLTVWVIFVSDTMRVLYELAEPQAGYFTAGQAVAAGVSRRVLSGRTRRGDVEHVRYGIYRLRDFPASRFEDITAACLWAGLASVASHETALVVHGISDAMPSAIHLTVPQPFRGRRAGIVIHRAPLPDSDHEIRDSVPVTTMARTLRDVAGTSDPSLVRQAVEHAIEQGRLSRRQLRRIVTEAPELAPLVVDVLTENR
jgi:predicted transcriptional regulator of viral defense system